MFVYLRFHYIIRKSVVETEESVIIAKCVGWISAFYRNPPYGYARG